MSMGQATYDNRKSSASAFAKSITDERLRFSYIQAMLKADDIRNAVNAQGRKQSEIAALLGIHASAVSNMLSGKRRISLDEAAKLTAWLGLTPDEPAPAAPAPEMPAFPNIQSWPKDVPVHGTALGGDLEINGITGDMQVEQTVLEFADTIEMVRRPPAFASNRALYAVYVAGSSMEPRYEPGDLIYADPRRPPSIGDDVIVQLRDGNGQDGDDRVICALIKRLVRRSAAGVELEQYNPPLRFKIANEHVAAVHRVVKLGEVMGV